MEGVRKAVRWIAIAILATPFTVYIGAVLERLFDKWGWLEDPAAPLSKAATMFVLMYQHPWFIPGAVGAVFFAAGVWLDALLRKFSAAEKEAKITRIEADRKRIGELGRRALSASRAMDAADHRTGITNHVLFCRDGSPLRGS